MLIGLIGSFRDETARSSERMQKLAMKNSQAIKQLPSGVTVKGRYLFSSGENAQWVVIFDVQSPEQLLPLQLSITDDMHYDLYPVIDNTEEVIQETIR